MGGDLHQASGGLELGEKLGQVYGAKIFREWPGIGLKVDGKEREQTNAGQRLPYEP
jgi:hypothetical protein